MPAQALAIANNDIVYLWWTIPAKIPDCLGFSVHRLVGDKPPVPLPAFVGFDKNNPDTADRKKHNTDYWPIQSFQWKDLFVPEETDVAYEIFPVQGTPGEKLKEISGHRLRTKPIRATDRFGDHRVIFNRGIISTQALSRKIKKLNDGKLSDNALRAHIGKKGDAIRNGLAGESIEALTSLLNRARDQGGKCYLALYELTDTELIDTIAENKGRVELILSNADGTRTVGDKEVKAYDKTNEQTRSTLRKVLGDALHDRLLPKGNYIGHNKFIVYVDADDKPRTVLTGSTNWTPSGLCAQSNNILILENEAIASRYLDYWQRLKADAAQQGPAFRTTNGVAPPNQPLGHGAGEARIWFSPNTKQKSKAKNVTPGDMNEVFAAISGAKHGVLFLLFSAGTPSILTHIRDVGEERKAAEKLFFVRGAISDARSSKEFTTRVYNDGFSKGPNKLITGIGGVRDQFSFWERELEKLGHAVIHDKVVIVDPFSDDCVVITGSHNLGFKASFSNDENMVILRGNRPIAEAYTAHVLDIVNHYNWRNRLKEAKEEEGSATKAFADLEETDRWQERYFKGHFLESRDRFFFPGD